METTETFFKDKDTFKNDIRELIYEFTKKYPVVLSISVEITTIEIAFDRKVISGIDVNIVL